MSVTISILNDTDESDVSEYECMCADVDGKGHPECRECKGTGKVVFKSSKWERTLSNGNFSTFWSAMGLEFDYCGSIDPRDLLLAATTLNPELSVRATHVECREMAGGGKDSGPKFISCGLPREQVLSYIDSIRNICTRAIELGEKVCWS